MQILSYNLEAFLRFDENSIEKFLSMCENAVDNLAIGESAKFKLKSAIHELLINSLEHGYNKNPGKVSLSISLEGNSIVFEICDEGIGLDITSIDLNKKIGSIDDATSRGWGLIITHGFSSDMKITRNTPKGTKVIITLPSE